MNERIDRHARPEFDAPRSALLLMDFQGDIIADSPLATTDAEALERIQGAVERACELLVAARKSGLTPIHVRMLSPRGYPGPNLRSPLLRFIESHEVLIEGTRGFDFDPRVAPIQGEAIIAKRAISAFAGTDLAGFLAARDIRTLYLTGLVTHFVVSSTARDAHDRGFDVRVVEDACASASQQRHEVELMNLRSLGEVVSSHALLNLLAGS